MVASCTLTVMTLFEKFRSVNFFAFFVKIWAPVTGWVSEVKRILPCENWGVFCTAEQRCRDIHWGMSVRIHRDWVCEQTVFRFGKENRIVEEERQSCFSLCGGGKNILCEIVKKSCGL